MTPAEGIILGIIQGLTEFLPISSSGHLALAEIFGLVSQGDTQGNIAFFLVLHTGTLCAVILYMRRDITDILLRKRSLLVPLFISTALTGAVAIPLEKYIEKSFESVIIIGTGLLFTAGIIAAGEYIHRRRHLNISSVSVRTSAVIGLLQGIAPFPGVSRSGTTISAGCLCGLDRTTSAEYSFLLAIPAITAACIFKIDQVTTLQEPVSAAAGFIASFVSGYCAIALLIKIIKTRYFIYFALYTAVFGSCLVIYGVSR
mgnify:CR=1 FL=1